MDITQRDRRLFDRLHAEFPVSFEQADTAKDENLELRDLSAEGARIVSKRKVNVNEPVSLIVRLPDGYEPLILKGSIVWIEEAEQDMRQAGIQFDDINFMHMHRIMRMTR